VYLWSSSQRWFPCLSVKRWGKIHSECGWHHLKVWGPGCNQTWKGNWAQAQGFLSGCIFAAALTWWHWIPDSSALKHRQGVPGLHSRIECCSLVPLYSEASGFSNWGDISFPSFSKAWMVIVELPRFWSWKSI
jgi:hypothetical protein